MTDPIRIAASAIRPAAHPIAGVVVAACTYEVVADVINDLLDDDLLPSMLNTVQRFSWRLFGRKIVPSWSPHAAVLTAGIVLSAAARARARAKQSAQPSKR